MPCQSFTKLLFLDRKAGGNANGAFQGTGTQNTYSSGLNYNHIFSPTLLTEFRAGVAYYHSSATPADYGSNDAAKIGIPGVNINQFTSGQAQITINGGYTSPVDRIFREHAVGAGGSEYRRW